MLTLWSHDCVLYGYAPALPAGETQLYYIAGEEKLYNSRSGFKLIFQIYLSGNGFEPIGPSQMALGELEWMRASKAEVLFYHLSGHVCFLCL